jgi:hypothetical protein
LLKSLSTSILNLGLGLAVSLSVQADDLTIVFRMTGPGGEGVATHTFTATRVRFDHGDEATLVDFETGRMVSLSIRMKEYSETTFAEVERAMTSMSAEMEKAMAGIPEGLRSKMMREAAKEVTVTRGETREVAGIACQNYTVALGEKHRMETCTATSIQPPFDPLNFRKLALAMASVGPGNSGVNKMVEKMREIPGLSLASSTSLRILGRKIETVMEATQIRKGPVDASVFAIPQGFKKVDSPFATTKP